MLYHLGNGFRPEIRAKSEGCDVPDSAALAHTTDFLHAWYGPPGRPAGSGTNRSATGALLLGDCLEVMARMPSGSIKAVVTSPP